MGVCNCSLFCCTLLYVHFSIAIILMGKRELIALLNLSSWCLVMVERLFLTVPRDCLQFVIVVFPDHTHLLFLQWDICLIYLDDILTFGKSFDEAVENLEKVLDRLRTAGLKLKPKKCELFSKSVSFLGHIISDEGVATEPEKIKIGQFLLTRHMLEVFLVYVGTTEDLSKDMLKPQNLCIHLQKMGDHLFGQKNARLPLRN